MYIDNHASILTFAAILGYNVASTAIKNNCISIFDRHSKT